MKRRADMIIQSYRGTEETLADFALERERDGELTYEAAEPAAAPLPVAGLALFVDRDGAVCGQTPAKSIPVDVEAVIVGERVFVRAGPAGFREARTMSGSMP
ncbi:MAG: hypothetical protein V4750_02655 [Pseudomonadota bacterium]